MKALWMLLLLAISGCSMDISSNSAKPVKLQSLRTSGVEPVKIISAASLLPGDILLSSSTSLTSLSIRLFSLTGVSHASLYIGNNEVVEAVGKGVKIISLQEALGESNNLLALRRTNLSPAQMQLIRDFTLAHLGEKYNFKGIVAFAPFMATRRLCELPVFGAAARDRCLTLLASVQLSPDMPEEQPTFFCSQFVASAFAAAGAPLFTGEANWVSPADLLHSRQNDVASWQIPQQLSYVGHLKRWDLAQIFKLKRVDE